MPKRRSIPKSWAAKTLKLGTMIAILRGAVFLLLTFLNGSGWGPVAVIAFSPIFLPEILLWDSSPFLKSLGTTELFGVLIIGSFAWGFVLAAGAAVLDLLLPDPQDATDVPNPNSDPPQNE